MRKIWIIGAAISLTLILGACSSQIQAETTPTTIEATTEVETTVTETTTAIETTEAIAVMGKYGEYGKEMYDILVADWMEWLYADEGELRLNATAMLGSISEENYEAIIQEILAMDRGQNPYAASQAAALGQPLPSESASSESVPETQVNNEVKQSDPVQSNTSQPTQKPDPVVQPTQSSSSSDDSMISEEEFDRISEELGIGTPEGDTINSAEGWSGDIDAADFNWHQ